MATSVTSAVKRSEIINPLDGITHNLYTSIRERNEDLVLSILRSVDPSLDLNDVQILDGNHLIHVAVLSGSVTILKALAERGINTKILNNNGESAIHIAVNCGNLAMLKLLNEFGTSVDQQSKNGVSPLHAAVQQGNRLIISFLLQAGANPDIQNRQGESPLHLSVWTNAHEITNLLTANKQCALDITNKDGETPLIYATARGSLDSAKILIQSGADVNFQDRTGWTALQHAIKRRQTTIALMLINGKAKIDIADRSLDMPLHMACREGLLSVVQSLCAYGCRVSVYNKIGMTPLHIAAENGHLEIIRCLLLAGANPTAPSRTGITAEQIAHSSRNQEIAKLISTMKPERRSICVEQLVPTQKPLPRIRLNVFGSSGAGKSQLIRCLKSNVLPGFMRKKLKSRGSSGQSIDNEDYQSFGMQKRTVPSSVNYEVQNENYTRGIEIKTISISSVGEFSVWEFSGYEPYFILYDFFIGDTNCINLLVFSLHRSYDDQRKEVLFWLDFVRFRTPIREPLGYCGKPKRAPKIMLVGTYFDLSTDDDDIISQRISAVNMLLEDVREIYKHTLDIATSVEVINCMNPANSNIKQIKCRLANSRNEILDVLPKANSFLEVILSKLDEWSAESRFPVITWEEFVGKVRRRVNPLCSEDHLKDLLQELQYLGRVIRVEDESGSDRIILNPKWFCQDVLGFLLSFDNVSQARVTGRFSVEDFQFMVMERESNEWISLLLAIGLCTWCTFDDEEAQLEFPCLNFLDRAHLSFGPQAQLSQSTSSNSFLPSQQDASSSIMASNGPFIKHAAVQFHTSPGQLAHIFPRIQCELRDATKLDGGDGAVLRGFTLSLYHGGAHFVSSSVSVCGGATSSPDEATGATARITGDVSVEDGDQAVRLHVYGAASNTANLFAVYYDVARLIETTLDDVCPAMEYETVILGAESFKPGRKDIRKVSQSRIFQSMLSLRPHQALGYQSTDDCLGVPALADLLCFGSISLLHRLKWGPDLHISSLKSAVKQRLSVYLDPIDSLGNDWCILAIRLGLQQEMPQIDNGSQWLRSRTSRVLDEWGRKIDSTIGKLIDILLELGQHNAADYVIQMAPLFEYLPDDFDCTLAISQNGQKLGNDKLTASPHSCGVSSLL